MQQKKILVNSESYFIPSAYIDHAIRKSKSIKGLDPYRYMLANEDSPEKFLKKIKNKFE